MTHLSDRFQAFGVGALEEEDEDIYSQDHMSNYDMTMEFEEDVHMGWTAPGRGKKHGKREKVKEKMHSEISISGMLYKCING